MAEPAYIAHRRKTDGATQSLEKHLLEVAGLSRKFASKIGLTEQGELIGLVHDLGKYSKEFQAYLKSSVGLLNQDEDEEFVDVQGLKGRVDHSTAGAQLVWKEVTRQTANQTGIEQVVGQILALCIASHHSGLIDCLSSDKNNPVENIFDRRIKKSDGLTHLSEAESNMDASISRRLSGLLNNSQVVDGIRNTLSQIATLDKNETIIRLKMGLLVRFLFSCLIDADRVNTADFEKPKSAKKRLYGGYTGWDVLIERLEKRLLRFENSKEIDRIRKEISDCCREKAQKPKGIYTLTVPTGGGKTLASFRFALHHAQKWGMDRIIYITPFTTIIDQNAGVVRDVLELLENERDFIVLEHHSNLTPEQQGWQEKILAENWDAPVVFTTSVQFFDSLFAAGTRGARRMHQLANAVIIFDEVQTVPIKCVHLFNNAVNFLVEQCGSTGVLCTATQPLLNKVDEEKGAMRFTEGNEIVPNVKQLFKDLKRVEVLDRCEPGGWSDDRIVDLAIEEATDSGSCLVIVNTKMSAQKLFQICRQKTEIPVYHLSTHMCPVHRKETLEEVRKLLICPDFPLICISTQLIEAGVDIDFGTVIRFAAGLDSIAQAAGRCNRHRLRDIGRVHVVNPADESLDKLKDIRDGVEVTRRLLSEAVNGEWKSGYLLSPEAMKRYFGYYFFAKQKRDEMSYRVSANAIGRDDTLLNLLSINPNAVEEYERSHGEVPHMFLRQSFMSAAKEFKVINAPTRGIIVPYKDGRQVVNDLCSVVDVEKKFRLLRKAQRYTVNVFPHVLDQLQNKRAIDRIQENVDILYLLDARYYSRIFGLSQIPEEDMEVPYV